MDFHLLNPAQAEPSYVVGVTGSIISATPASGSGLAYYSGSDPATVIRKALSTLGANGGTVYLKAGTYLISTDQSIGGNFVCLPMYSNTALIGEGESTILKLDSKANL